MNLIKKNLHILILIFISFALFIANYQSGTWLLGWDNVIPEFNIGLNISRSLSSVWQEGRGLGLYDGMAHAANLIHTIAIGGLSILLPDNILRYVFIILMHLAGGTGFFVLSKRMFKNNTSAFFGALFYMFNMGVIQMFYAPLEVFAVHFAALPWLALSTNQALKKPIGKNLLFLFMITLLISSQGFVPTVWLASAVLIASIILSFLVSGTPRRAPSSAQTNQALDGTVAGQAPLKLQTSLLRSFLVLTIFLTANSFWLLPYLYGLPKTTSVIQNARINQYSSFELYERNKVRGDLASVLSLKGFMIDTVELNVKSSTNEYFMDVWKRHTDSPAYIVISSLLALIALYGILRGLTSRNRAKLLPFALSGSIAFMFLANSTPGVREINGLIRMFFPTLAEAFRIPFTKFIILFAFCFSIFLAYGLHRIIQLLGKKRTMAMMMFIGAVFIFMIYPAFTGNFFSPLLKIQLPREYQQAMDYLDELPHDQRIALLPAHTFWNWQYRDFGQRGSDFLWYGIPQPILLRAFDPWSRYNEQFYNELNYAIKIENIELFDNVLAKYNVSYILLDTNLINNLNTKPINYERLERFLTQSKILKQKKAFSSLVLYKNISATSWLTTIDKLPITKPFDYSYEDVIFSNHGHYLASDSVSADVLYPFALFFFEKNYPHQMNITTIDTDVNIQADISTIQGDTYILEFPSILTVEQFIPARFEVKSNLLHITLIYPAIVINNISGQVEAEEYFLPIKGVVNPTRITLLDTDQTITPGGIGYIQSNFPNSIKVSNDTKEQLITFDTNRLDSQPFQLELTPRRLSTISVEMPAISTTPNFTIVDHAKDNSNSLKCAKSHVDIHNERSKNVYFETICDTGEIASYIASLPHNSGYLIRVRYKYVSGLPLTVYIDNYSEKRAEFETQLPTDKNEQYLIIPATQEYFKGYGLHIVSKSSGFTPSINTIDQFSIQPLPTNFLKEIRLVKKTDQIARASEMKSIRYEKTGTWLYTAYVRSGQTLVLSQAFDKDWSAYIVKDNGFVSRYLPFLKGQKISKHYLVDNWANGWTVSQKPVIATANKADLTDSEKLNEEGLLITILFWPQYLEFVGFGVMIAVAIMSAATLKVIEFNFCPKNERMDNKLKNQSLVHYEKVL